MQILVRNTKASLCLLALSLWFVPGAQAQDEEEKRGWYFSADLSYVLTAGNAEASTIGLGLKADRYWERSRLKLAARGIRVESALKTRTAVGSSQDDFQLVEEKNTETTAENYLAGAKYDWDVAEVLFLFGSADWVRNTFAGVESRVVMTAGAGNTILDDAKHTLRTNYGLTTTYQKDVASDPSRSDWFGGLRFGYNYDLTVTETAQFESTGILDSAFDDFEDIRINWLNSLSVSISQLLALKAGLLLQWDNTPSLTEVPLENPLGTPTGETVFVPLEELDTAFNVALVLNF